MKRRVVSVLMVLALLFVSGILFAEGQKESGEAQQSGSKAEVIRETVNDFFASIPADNNKIGQKEFVEMVKAGEDPFILSIRQAKDYNEGHVEGAVNVPWGPNFAKSLDFMPADETVYVYCYSGQTAGQTVALLEMAGIDAKSVNLGYNFGISKVDGVDEVITTEPTELGDKTGISIDPVIRTAIENYYEGLADVSDTMFKNYKISEKNMKEIVDSGADGYYILSIRQEKHYNEEHIPGAELIPWGAGMQEQFSSLPADQKILTYCYTGQTAGQTVAGLRLLGYDAVSLNGGIGWPPNKPLGWKNKGYETVSN